MKAKFSLIGTGTAMVCLIGIVIYASQKTKEADNLRAAAQLHAAQTSANSAAAAAAGKSLTPEQQFRIYMDFERDMRRFLRDKDTLDQAERTRQAKALMGRVDEREKAMQVSAPEGMKLKMALIRAMEPDERKQAQQIGEMIVRYQVEAERQQTAFLDSQRNDPRFQAYKTREAQIVAEVETMQRFPGGMSRDEYLRQRLLEARAAIYYTPAPTDAQAPAPQPPTP
ncbi:MAG: hypothetical protein E6Q50_08520 [Lysobacter sp.]|nr:MAG: hypothetical protein E6Q50_08520 [Lysobacter sp.]